VEQCLVPTGVLTNDKVKPISIGMLGFFATCISDYSGMMAAIVMIFLPPLLVYIFAQEQVEKGLTAGALKG
jgi:raffinose/stachyose/melibiose transport system permease protein